MATPSFQLLRPRSCRHTLCPFSHSSTSKPSVSSKIYQEPDHLATFTYHFSSPPWITGWPPNYCSLRGDFQSAVRITLWNWKSDQVTLLLMWHLISLCKSPDVVYKALLIYCSSSSSPTSCPLSTAHSGHTLPGPASGHLHLLSLCLEFCIIFPYDLSISPFGPMLIFHLFTEALTCHP